MSQHVERIETQSLKGKLDIVYERPACADLARGAKNLVSTVETTTAGESKQLAQIDARILQYEWKCKKRNLGTETIKERKEHLARLIRARAMVKIKELSLSLFRFWKLTVSQKLP
jgi:hypothetical protein